MIFLLNLITFCCLLALGFLFKTIEWVWGQETVIVFSLGWIAATVMWQCAHRMRYGLWFDPPDISGESSGPGSRAAAPSALAGGTPKISPGGALPPPAIKP